MHWRLGIEPKPFALVLTLNGPGLVGVQHDVGHEGELGRTLAERLDEPEHA